MKIIVEPSDYILRNVGDIAMLHTAATRLGKLFPNDSIEIFSDEPERLPTYCSNTKALSSFGRKIWFKDGILLGKFSSFLPKWIYKLSVRSEKLFRHYTPALYELLLLGKLGNNDDRRFLKQYLDSVKKADLLVVSDMGGLTDFFYQYAYKLLESIRLAKKNNTIVVMVGQGIGPLKSLELRSLAKKVLKDVDFISLREGVKSNAILQELGIKPDHILVTGDDAIELAFLNRNVGIRNGLGINLRKSNYSSINDFHVIEIKKVIEKIKEKINLELIPLPISNVPEEADLITINQLIGKNHSAIYENNNIEVIKEVISHVNKCRVVVTGSYHAAVFALASGIPAVCLANSEYYEDKFIGLANQFGRGCEVIFLKNDNLVEKLNGSIKNLWHSAEEVRPLLLNAASVQIELCNQAYQHIVKIVESKKKKNVN